jgi:integrase/recombinase XerD
MAGKQAKILSSEAFDSLRAYASSSRYPVRNTVIVLLSVKAGLRAGEIAKLTWPMILDPDGKIGRLIELHDKAAKKGSGRSIPIHPELAEAFEAWAGTQADLEGPVIRSERGGSMTPLSIVVWFRRAYELTGLKGCSSHSGRRTFITRAARLAHKAGGSLRDVQLLAGHASIQTTQCYIDGDTDAQRRLVTLI